MSKCVTCNQDKDKFSQDWEYQQCQSCSMKEGESKMKEWILELQENGDDGTGFNDYKEEE